LEITGNTVLITGGASGIGFALAQAFLKEGNEVIICGRRTHKLQEAKRKLPHLHMKRSDVAKESERERLFRWVSSNFSEVNILVNNAGIQRQVNFTSSKITNAVPLKDDEVAVNLVASIRLCALFTPTLMKRKKAAIVNISSGLAFVPIAMMPVYCATKAAIHSFSISLRHQLRDTSVRVFEAAPPTTDTELDRSFASEQKEEYRGISPQEVATAIIEGMKAGTEEIIIGEAWHLFQAAQQDPNGKFKQLNG
jgi:uncharacterized oxidoreductase